MLKVSLPGTVVVSFSILLIELYKRSTYVPFKIPSVEAPSTYFALGILTVTAGIVFGDEVSPLKNCSPVPNL